MIEKRKVSDIFDVGTVQHGKSQICRAHYSPEPHGLDELRQREEHVVNARQVARAVQPAKILVLEDDMLNAFLIEESLQLAGHQVVGPAKTIPHALTLIDQREVDAAILDLQIGNKFSFNVGRRLDELGIPWAITTGHTHAEIDPDFAHVRVLVKPFTVTSLLGLVEATIGSASVRRAVDGKEAGAREERR